LFKEQNKIKKNEAAMQALSKILKDDKNRGDLNKIICVSFLFNLTKKNNKKSFCIVSSSIRNKSSYDVCTICIHKVCVENSLRTTISYFANLEEQSKSDLVSPRNTHLHCKNTSSNPLQSLCSGVINPFHQIERCFSLEVAAP
jgi:chorismate mutase